MNRSRLQASVRKTKRVARVGVLERQATKPRRRRERIENATPMHAE